MVFVGRDGVIGLLQDLGFLARVLVGNHPDQRPIRVILRFGQHHALGRHQLRGIRVPCTDRHLHGLVQRFAQMTDHLAARRLGFGVESQLFKYGQKDAVVRARFFQTDRPPISVSSA
ncbi:hypothetical protein G6F40_016531 [Rhizopus arrhizus]|nr:hypothetical protein G6F40_016531 [Rhizopus arrhizus]